MQQAGSGPAPLQWTLQEIYLSRSGTGQHLKPLPAGDFEKPRPELSPAQKLALCVLDAGIMGD